MYAQNNEDELILNYFQGKPGTILDIGANDGVTFSNSKLLIEYGWKAVLVEPADWAFEKLNELHKDNENVQLLKYGIGDTTGKYHFWVSDTLLNKGDKNLVSTFDANEKTRWGTGVNFTEDFYAEVITFKELLGKSRYKIIDFISLDAEGFDLKILRQINFNDIGCRCICVEWNSVDFYKYDSVVRPYGFRLLHQNAENLLYVR